MNVVARAGQAGLGPAEGDFGVLCVQFVQQASDVAGCQFDEQVGTAPIGSVSGARLFLAAPRILREHFHDDVIDLRVEL
jgi:hypothetical protein